MASSSTHATTRAAQRAAQTGTPASHERSPLPNDMARPLPPALAQDMGQRFGADFGSVKLHQGTAAHQQAEALDARAYTVGEHVVLGRNAPPLSSQDGRRTLAHELAHVVQQRRGGPPPLLSSDAPHEHAADRAASAAASGQGAVSVGGATGVGVARDADKDAEAIRKRNQARLKKVKGADSGIVEEQAPQTDAASPTTRKVPTTAKATKARKDFNQQRDVHAKALGVAKGGQVHHGVELQALKRYPEAFSPEELNARANMRGIRPEQEGKRQLHNRKIREAWDRHYNNLDALLKQQGFKKGTPQYRAFARRYLLAARAEMDHVLGQFYSEAHKDEAAKAKARTKTRTKTTGQAGTSKAAQGSGAKPPAKASPPKPAGQGTSAKALAPKSAPPKANAAKANVKALPAAPKAPKVAPVAKSAPAKLPAAKPYRALPKAMTTTAKVAPLARAGASAVLPRRASTRGTGGSVFAMGVQIIAGQLHQAATAKRIAKQAESTGWVPFGAPSGEGRLYDIGSWLLDPFNDADKSVGMEQRFVVSTWRKNIREKAAEKQVGETIDFNWQVGKDTRDSSGDQEREDVKVQYRKGEDGRWKPVSGQVPANAPDFNDILSEDVPDATIEAAATRDPFSS